MLQREFFHINAHTHTHTEGKYIKIQIYTKGQKLQLRSKFKIIFSTP